MTDVSKVGFREQSPPPPKNFLKIEMILCNLPGIWVVWVGKSAF